MKTGVIQTASIEQPNLNKFMFFNLLMIALYMTTIALAYAGEPTPMGDVLCTVVGFIYGNLGRGLATLAVAILGVGATLGKVSWGMAITVGVGISVIFNAGDIVVLLGVGGASC